MIRRNMLKIREEVEHEIWWQPTSGYSNFWYDNWTKLDALYYVEEGPVINDEA